LTDIYLLWPTARPKTFLETHKFWMDKCVHPEACHTKVVVDSVEDAEILKDFKPMVVNNTIKGIVYPLFQLLKDFKANPRDIMVVPSDDFYPPINWDMYLREKMLTMKMVLQVNDGNMSDIMALPVMTYAAYEMMNRIIYHPAYSHMFCDKELYDTAMELAICEKVDPTDPLFEHKHYFFQTREMDDHDKILDEAYAEGKAIYTKRRYLTFQERLGV